MEFNTFDTASLDQAATDEQRRRIRAREDYDRLVCSQIANPQPKISHPLRLLSLDGGGIRGLLSLLMLKGLMDKVGHGIRPCDYFDLIAGTSTGGLIAIMLGRLRMSVEDCIEAYLKLAREIFGVNIFSQFGSMIWGGARFDGTKLRAAIESLVALRGRGEKMEEGDAENICRTFVVSIPGLRVGKRPKLFRSYDNVPRSALADDCFIWEAACATSCAPFFFPEIQVQGIVYTDGGLGHNNPSRLVLEEAKSLWGDHTPVECLISLGTGYFREDIVQVKSVLDIPRLWSAMQDISLSCEEIHEHMDEHFRIDRKRGAYFRFNVVLEKNIDLHEWKKMEDIQIIALHYIHTESKRFTQCADYIHKGLPLTQEWALRLLGIQPNQ